MAGDEEGADAQRRREKNWRQKETEKEREREKMRIELGEVCLVRRWAADGRRKREKSEVEDQQTETEKKIDRQTR